MPYELESLELEEVSLVDKGANQHSKVTITKRKELEVMTDAEFQELHKMCDEDMKKLKAYMDKGMTREEAMTAMRDEMKKSLDEAVEKAVALEKAFDEAGYDVAVTDGVANIAKRATPEYITIDGEKIEKALIPAPVLKKLEEAEKVAEVAKIEKAANELPNFPGTSAERGKLVITAKSLGKEIEAMLAAADKLFEGMTKEVGKAAKNDDAIDPAEKIANMAKSYAEEKGVPFVDAYNTLLQTDPVAKDLYKQARKLA